MVKHEGNSTTPFQYCGQYGVLTDPNGLCYMRARYYSPEIRRFVNQDVVIGNAEDGQRLNRFAYVNGEPVNSVDPFGLFSLKNSLNKMKNSINTAKQVVKQAVKKAEQGVEKVVDWLTKPSTLKTIKKVTAVTGGVAAVAALVVTAPVAVSIIGGVTVISTGLSALSTIGLWSQEKDPWNQSTLINHGGDLLLDLAVPLGVAKIAGKAKALTVMAEEGKGWQASLHIGNTSVSLATGTRAAVDLATSRK